MTAIDRAKQWLPEPRKISPRFSTQLDCLRWLAAFLVCITHARSLMFVDYAPDAGGGWFLRAFYFVHGFGREAVMIFFILSGYLVGGEVIRELQRGRFSWRHYLFRRATRLYPVYLGVLLVGGMMDHAGLRLLPDTGLYTHAVDSPMIYYDASARLGWSTLLGNLVFCQELLVPSYGSNVPLWSLTNEAWYYLLFPMATVALFRPQSTAMKCVHAALLVAITLFLWGPVLVYFSIWLLGLVPHFLRRPVVRPAAPLIAGMLALLLVLRLRIATDVPVFAWHVALGLMLMLLLNTLEHGGGPIPPGAPIHKFLAAFSYSQYLLHWPLTVFLCGLAAHYFHRGVREPVTATSLVLYIALLAVVYGASWVLAWFTEFRTAALRGRFAGAMASA